MDKNKIDLKSFRLQTQEMILPKTTNAIGTAHVVDKSNFPALNGVTCFTLELWEACMRLPHWHPNAAELGYVISGQIEIIIWRSPGETSMFTLSAGMCWFIPQAALHSLNNIGREHARLLVGFSTDLPQDIDLPVAFNGIPVPVRDAYTSPHDELRQWQGVTINPLVGRCPVNSAVFDVKTGSPYGFDLAQVTPLFKDEKLGSVTWAIKSNWNILQRISALRAHLKPGVARDAIWYPDVGTLYVVAQGKGEFHIVTAESNPTPLSVKLYDYVYVPTGVLHTFLNTSSEDFEVIAFFTHENPQPEVSLSVSTSFFPNNIRRAAMTEYGSEQLSGDPLKNLQYTTVSPYLLPINKK